MNLIATKISFPTSFEVLSIKLIQTKLDCMLLNTQIHLHNRDYNQFKYSDGEESSEVSQWLSMS